MTSRVERVRLLNLAKLQFASFGRIPYDTALKLQQLGYDVAKLENAMAMEDNRRDGVDRR